MQKGILDLIHRLNMVLLELVGPLLFSVFLRVIHSSLLTNDQPTLNFYFTVCLTSLGSLRKDDGNGSENVI